MQRILTNANWSKNISSLDICDEGNGSNGVATVGV